MVSFHWADPPPEVDDVDEADLENAMHRHRVARLSSTARIHPDDVLMSAYHVSRYLSVLVHFFMNHGELLVDGTRHAGEAPVALLKNKPMGDLWGHLSYLHLTYPE